MNDEELFNLNQKVSQTHFYRSYYLRLMLEGYQAKEKMPTDLNEFHCQLLRLYTPLGTCRFMLSSRYKSVSEKLEKAIDNIGTLDFEIMETLAISEKIRSDVNEKTE